MDHHVKQTPVQGVTGLWGGTQGSLTTASPALVGEDYSVDFDGNDFLSVAASSAFHIGTSDYTVELWMYKDSNGELISAFEKNSPYKGWLLGLNYTANSKINWFMLGADGNSATLYSTANVASGQWQHVAVTRSGDTWRIFLDGTLDSTHTSDVDPGDSGENIMIGADKNYPPTAYRYFNGKISNLRIVKGQCLYTSSFTPATSPLGNTTQGASPSNVKLLCCNQSTVTGSVVTPSTITVGLGDPSSADGPF